MNIILEPQPLPSGLYLVGTPIGNLRDITLRALETLSACDALYCEDTRVTGKLLKAYGISKKMEVFTDHSSDKDRAQLLARISEKGQSVALVSDAGLPLISDPGYKLVSYARAQNIDVWSIPGASAPLTALQVSGLPTDSFLFAGFIPTKEGQRKAFLEKLCDVPATLIFFETVPRLSKTLAAIENLYGERKCIVARELTKKFEEILSGTPQDLLERLEEAPIKGEVVLLVEGAVEKQGLSEEDVLVLLKTSMKTNSLKDAVKLVSAQTSMPKNQVYELALSLK